MGETRYSVVPEEAYVPSLHKVLLESTAEAQATCDHVGSFEFYLPIYIEDESGSFQRGREGGREMLGVRCPFLGICSPSPPSTTHSTYSIFSILS